MKHKNWNCLLYIHSFLLLWFFLFIVSLLIPDGGRLVKVLAIGNVGFLFVNIPLSVFSFILRAKNKLQANYKVATTVLAAVNFAVGVIMWLFVIMLLLKP